MEEIHDEIEAFINRITALSAPRERAIFAVMRQSGLKPSAIKRLRLNDIETSKGIPFKIELPMEEPKPPAFIGKEAIVHLRQYFATRKENITSDNLVFANHKSPDKEINTKDISRTFRRAAEKVTNGKTPRLQLLSLVKFYRTRAKHYLKELKNHPNASDETYRNLYKKHALPFLEIENQIIVKPRAPKEWFNQKIQRQEKEIKEKNLKIAVTDEYISSILSLFYDNKGDWDTGENVKIGDNLIKLWQKASDLQLTNIVEFLNGRSQYIPVVDIVKELTKTLERILEPYKKLKRLNKSN